MSNNNYIRIKGSKVNNLQNVSLDIPRNQLIVITGLSGSGKSSLAFDTLYAEGQRRYIESLSAYARLFLGKINKPNVEYIHGLPPAIAIEQKVNTQNPRSTLGTSTEIYEYIKLLYARLGETYSPISGELVKRDSVSDVCDYIFSLPEDVRIILYAPFLIRNERSPKEQLQVLLKQGFNRIQIKDEIIYIDDYLKQKQINHEEIHLLIDRFTADPSEENQSRVADSIETAFFEGQGACYIEIHFPNGPCKKHSFSNKFEKDGITFKKPSINMFSFNNPYGACPRCEGFGNTLGIDPDLVIPDKSLSVYEDAIVCWKTEKMSEYKDQLIKNASRFHFPIHRPIYKLSKEEYQLLWDGNEYFEGINSFFSWVESNTYKIQYRVMLSRYKGKTICPLCKGSRLTEEAAYVKVEGVNIHTLIEMPLEECLDFFNKLTFKDTNKQLIAERLVKEIRTRLRFLCELGLGYLSLNRSSNTLSGGESQRVNLAGSLGSSLVGSLYILDEPSIGLHSKNTQELIKVLQHLRDIGNTVVVVEHDEDIIRAADHIIDTGPLSGRHGGQIVFQGNIQALYAHPSSITGKYLRGEASIDIPITRRKSNGFISLKNVSLYNIRNISVDIPLHALVLITGVSGSGKSTLIKEILYPLLSRHIETISINQKEVFPHLSGDLDQIAEIELVDQNPIGRSSRSNPATYLGAFEYIRQLFAEQALSKSRGYKPGFFSFNVEGGRCEACQGEGRIHIKMQFMADVDIECDECKGKCYKDETLEVNIDGKNIYDILQLTVDEAIAFFQSIPSNRLTQNIIHCLQPLSDVGVGYLQLAQSSASLSGGEAQRIKLALFLGKGNKQKNTLFIFDEPTTGLHFHDIKNLYKTFQELIKKGHSLIIIEHNLELIKCADWIIDLGPEGGNKGGQVVCQGTPEDIIQHKDSYTAQYLMKKLIP
ncbi:MAG: excinuclease ABC subunit UvrA [Bacteroidales bacterium]|nr:excinuclease ABC subunit UvrA [Bacteroidales bacterium]MDD3330712.1 excinuclease ABC subunit UvrA [Bacteroidales bacterium]MDD3690933.1 excinuclease ABC subunit UvrA [Bacteroidales bacterium]MDD4044661.1 excinuclease ABC subunit UvrA [Bacteroidales bacterium]MDD4581715.1 excinuclease ABC subunit UvrA [Bacteroidales bacterium]